MQGYKYIDGSTKLNAYKLEVTNVYIWKNESKNRKSKLKSPYFIRTLVFYWSG